jgi:HK97 gp10 family phage protein
MADVGMSLQITGLQEVQQMLKDAPRIVVASAFVNALDAGAQVIKAALAPRIPVSDEETAGELKAALMSTVTLDPQLRGGVAEVGFGTKQGHIANFVEYGHRMVGHKPGKIELGMVSPHPFMRPAAEVSADAAIEAFADTLETTLRAGSGLPISAETK